MNAMDLLIALATLLGQAASFLRKAGYSKDDEVFMNLEWDRNDSEALYYVQFLHEAAEPLYTLYERMCKARRTPKSRTWRLRLLEDGRYGYTVSKGFVKELTCGSQVEALIDMEGQPYWLECVIEHDGDDYYVCRYHVPMEGLLVRETR